MKNQDLTRTLPKNDTYFNIRVACTQLSKKLKRRVTIKEFLVKAAEKFLKEDYAKYFK